VGGVYGFSGVGAKFTLPTGAGGDDTGKDGYTGVGAMFETPGQFPQDRLQNLPRTKSLLH